MPKEQYSPATKSEIGIAARIGPLFSVPFKDIKPLKACAIKSNAGLSLISPSLPKPLTQALISLGFIDCKTLSSKPILAKTPALKFSTTTSASLNKDLRISLSVSLYRSNITDFLFLLNCAKYELYPSIMSP